MDLAGEAGSDAFTVIGVARDTKLYGVDPEGIDSPTPVAFVPYAFQQTLTMGLTIRVAGDPASITGNVRAALRAADPNLPLYQARTMDDQRRLNYWQYGLYGWIFGTIGVVGMLLAGIGLYGVLAYNVTQRTRELGLRLALGAAPVRLRTMVLKQVGTMAVVGAAIGLAAALALGRVAESLVYGLSGRDPFVIATAVAVLAVVVLAGSWWPARRASRIAPTEALRYE
jgi:predicted lysophospholipase L1 biosynthesis ABC-type transport system permease subunit